MLEAFVESDYGMGLVAGNSFEEHVTVDLNNVPAAGFGFVGTPLVAILLDVVGIVSSIYKPLKWTFEDCVCVYVGGGVH
jgi:hypothetical protein